MQFEPFQFQTSHAGVILPEKRSRAFIPQTYGKNVVEEFVPPPPPPPPTFSEAELKAAEQDGYRKGFLEGEKQGKLFAESEIAMIEKNTHALLQPLAEQILSMFAHYNQFIMLQKKNLPKLALAIAQKASKETMSHQAILHVESTTIACIERMLGEPELHVYVHPELSDALEDKLARHFANSHENGDVLIHKDEKMLLGACRIEWKNGGLEYTPETFWNNMHTLIESVAAAELQTHEEINADSVLNQLETVAIPDHAAPSEAETVADIQPELEAEVNAAETLAQAPLAAEDAHVKDMIQEYINTPTDTIPDNTKE